MGFRYDWQGASPIKEIDVAVNSAGWLQVVIYAPAAIDDKLADLPLYLAKNGFICYLDEVDGKSVLKIADFGKEERVFDLLRRGGFVFGEPARTEIPDEFAELAISDRIRKDSMKISGILGEIGHIAMIALGALTKDIQRIGVGLFYGTATALPAAFGNGAGAIRFSKLANGLRNYLSKEGYELADPLIKTPEIDFRNRNILTRLWDMIKSHPVQAQNLIALPGNILLTVVGRKESRKNEGKSGKGLIVSGILAAISSLIAIFVPEATPEQIKAYKNKKGFIRSLREDGVMAAIKTAPDSIYMFLSKQPLAVSGSILAAENIFGVDRQALDAARNYKRKSETHPEEPEGKVYFPILSGVMAGAWTSSSAAGALSTKRRNELYETKEAYDALYAQTANLILGAPRNSQDIIVGKAAEYLAAEPDVHVRAEVIEKELRDKVNALRNNPWAKTVVKARETVIPPANTPPAAAVLDNTQSPDRNPPSTTTDNQQTQDLRKTADSQAMQTLKNMQTPPLQAQAGLPKPTLDSATAGTTIQQQVRV